jgi:hypothetical protein
VLLVAVVNMHLSEHVRDCQHRFPSETPLSEGITQERVGGGKHATAVPVLTHHELPEPDTLFRFSPRHQRGTL